MSVGEAPTMDTKPVSEPEAAPTSTPRATYRLQFGESFGFRAARELVPYLSRLGVSHVYTSPLLAARPGSSHRYDIVDHGRLDPNLGTPDEFEELVASLRSAEMGILLDFVPNHMGIGTDNPWWTSVLEWGPSSPVQRFFDIDWDPLEPTLAGKLLLPVLGDHYGRVLERGEFRPGLDRDGGSFWIHHGETRFPLAPRDYPSLLREAAQHAPQGTERLLAAAAEVDAILAEEPQQAVQRMEAFKLRLAGLLRRDRVALDAVEEVLGDLAGTEGDPRSFDALHALLERQAYRLAFWRVATHEINYRRFFDISALAGLRMEDSELFRESHALVRRLLAEGKIHGLRLDHVDGLRDPAGYLRRLESHASPAYVVVEKILASHETLRPEWPVHGTTGYDFLARVNGLLVDPAAERALTRIWERFVGSRQRYREVEAASKRAVMQETLASELNVLATAFNRMAKSSRHTRDYTRSGLREALMDVVASFGVYRTYVTEEGADDEDRREIEGAVGRARRLARQGDGSIYSFIQDVLTLDLLEGSDPDCPREAVVDAALRFQQYTGPVMAKSVEDTAFYRYLRLVSLNEVGGEPGRFGTSPGAFHESNRRRLRQHPASMVATATHDHKRGEDVRARLAVLSEIPRKWAARVHHWRRMNRAARSEVDGDEAPAPADEYLVYQTVVGAWPLELDPASGSRLEDFRERVVEYIRKASREASLRTSWLAPDEAYESALEAFVRDLLGPRDGNPFLEEVEWFVGRIAPTGAVNGLSQLALKLTVPGVPDFYQGTELWDQSLVDPDNRRPVDYGTRIGSLAGRPRGADAWRALLTSWRSGVLKQHLAARLLELRRERPDLFLSGDYRPLEGRGTHSGRIVGFAREGGGGALVVVVPRLVHSLMDGADVPLPRGWEGTTVSLPLRWAGRPLRDVFTGLEATPGPTGELRVGELLSRLPVSVLLRA
jgi:(1->4)-alpha-D-glucan 1-alpha-D-glucosylmutase